MPCLADRIWCVSVARAISFVLSWYWRCISLILNRPVLRVSGRKIAPLWVLRHGDGLMIEAFKSRCPGDWANVPLWVRTGHSTPGQPNVCFAPIAVIRESAVRFVSDVALGFQPDVFHWQSQAAFDPDRLMRFIWHGAGLSIQPANSTEPNSARCFSRVPPISITTLPS